MHPTPLFQESAGLGESWQLVPTESRITLEPNVGTGGKPSTWFPPGTRRAKQRSEGQCLLQIGRCCNLAADLPDQLAGHQFAAVCPSCCWLGSLAARSLSVFCLAGQAGSLPR